MNNFDLLTDPIYIIIEFLEKDDLNKIRHLEQCVF